MTPDEMTSRLDQLKQLAEQIKNSPADVTTEQLADAVQAVREITADAKGSEATPALVKALTDLKAVREAVLGEQTARAEETARVNDEAAKLLAEFEEPEAEKAETDGGNEGGGNAPAAEVVETPPDAPAEQVETREPALAASAVREMQRTNDAVKGLTKVLTDALTAAAKPTETETETPRPQGRSAAPGALSAQTRPAVPAAPRDVVTAHTFGGQDKAGAPINNNLELARSLHDKFRTTYQDGTFSGRIPIAHTAFTYPESRVLGSNESENYLKMEALTSPTALVAAGGLCAPLTPDYSVEVIGTSARPVKDQALVRVAVERGGLQFRPPISSAAAVNGAGQWTMDDDEAASVVNNTGPTKACYEVDCPNMVDEVVWAAYLCLEFSNITTRFDPETTVANLRSGDIAHARLADNLLHTKMAAQSKLLSGARIIGAVRDVLVNVDKATAYLRSRHRIDEAMPLTWLAPFWVKHLFRADLSRQMAAGDWKDALGTADALINQWFSVRGVNPVWHMDGIGGTDEVQTVTITGGPTGGTFTLSYAGDTTDPIAYNATAAQVRSALAGLDTLDAEDITVTGGPGPGSAWTVTFGGGEVDGVNVAQMTSAGSFTGGTSPAVSVATTTGGDGAITVNGVTIPSQTYDNAAPGTAIPSFPDKIDSLLYPTGSWYFLDGGSLDLGLVRDSTLNAKNRYRQFMETFEGAAFKGVESLRLVMEVEPTGQTAGTKDLDAVLASL